MYENNEEKSNYEGIFARQPDHTESTVWGTTETHAQTFGPDTAGNTHDHGYRGQKGFGWVGDWPRSNAVSLTRNAKPAEFLRGRPEPKKAWPLDKGL
jgi:hypothetical protein